jgi:hypothetical protein
MPEKIKPAYLGDGVYVRFDGYQLWLAANHHTNEVIALEPRVLKALVEYAREVNDVYDTNHFPV